MWIRVKTWWGRRPQDEAGMTTVEYALGTLAAAAFAVVLMKILTGDSVAAKVTAVIERALSGSV